MIFTEEELNLLKIVVPLGAMQKLIIHNQIHADITDPVFKQQMITHHDKESKLLVSLARKISDYDNRTT